MLRISSKKGTSMRSTMVAVIAALLLGSSNSAFAGGGQSGDWELGIYGGYGWLDDYATLRPKDNALFGARLGYFFTPQWSTEVSAQRLSTHTQFEAIGATDFDFHLDALRLNALYNFGSNPFRPFLTAGIGYEKLDAEDFGESGDVGWNAGGGFRWFVTPRWNLRADARYVGVKVDEVDESQGNVEATVGLAVTFGGGGVETAVAPTPVNGQPMVTLASDRPEILPGETVGLHATASDPDGDPLTYEWSTTAGHVTGSGANTTLDFEGTTPPSTATVTVRVSDGRGGTASANTTVRLLEPARPAEAVSCLAGGFPRNLARLTNVDKACLDDVAQRLISDPRAHVVVIGHADSRESSTQQLGEQRAQAVKTYLVSERSIDGARITTRSVGSTRPLGTGTDAAAQAGNRRAEIWFVPEGASEPN